MADLPQRRHPAHPHVVATHNKPIIVFLTVCTVDRRPILGHADAVHCLLNAWREACEWLVGRYVIMPDHVHLFCAPARLEDCPLASWIRYWKSLATKTWSRPEEKPIWQTDHWDRQLRTGESYSEKWD